MKRNLLAIILIPILVSTVSVAFSQSLVVGQVKNQKGEALAYANIGIKGGKLGTVSATDGKFSISVADSLLNDSLTFTSIGFKDKSYLIKTLTKKESVEIIIGR